MSDNNQYIHMMYYRSKGSKEKSPTKTTITANNNKHTPTVL